MHEAAPLIKGGGRPQVRRRLGPAGAVEEIDPLSQL
jgi:hypothetical protein